MLPLYCVIMLRIPSLPLICSCEALPHPCSSDAPHAEGVRSTLCSIARAKTQSPLSAEILWLMLPQATMQGGSPHTQEDTPHEEESEESIEAVENLLESYFMQIDSLYDRLVSMGE